ncbi:MAG: hypothetical protein SAK29_34570 [Scytonema sp. PMC 1069.18]|nr:hypothetical protein [Scytonema sp. PMC 1069.18]MEC4883835.1 hypothetical protein [Scytonema sp. PMC 1070.18]
MTSKFTLKITFELSDNDAEEIEKKLYSKILSGQLMLVEDEILRFLNISGKLEIKKDEII